MDEKKNAGYQHFLIFTIFFNPFFFSRGSFKQEMVSLKQKLEFSTQTAIHLKVEIRIFQNGIHTHYTCTLYMYTIHTHHTCTLYIYTIYVHYTCGLRTRPKSKCDLRSFFNIAVEQIMIKPFPAYILILTH